MRLVAPDQLADLCGLSPGLVGLAAAAGFALWLLGWWSHRFWVVLIATVSAGVYGLFGAPTLNVQSLLASLLLALAAGLLALALIRLFAFLAGGVLGLALLQTFAPALDQPLMAFLTTGLLGLVLFRWCVTAATSFAGSVVLVYACMILMHQRGTLDAKAYAEASGLTLTGIIAALTLTGFALQLWQERRRRRKPEDEEEKPVKKKSPPSDDDEAGFFGMFQKKAG